MTHPITEGEREDVALNLVNAERMDEHRLPPIEWCQLGAVEQRTYLNRADAAINAMSSGSGWRPIETAPKDGTLVFLLVDYSGEKADHWIDDTENGVGRTIGHNNDDNVGPGEGEGWQFAGWCWSHDHFVQGAGRAIAWQPLPAPPEIDTLINRGR